MVFADYEMPFFLVHQRIQGRYSLRGNQPKAVKSRPKQEVLRPKVAKSRSN